MDEGITDRLRYGLYSGRGSGRQGRKRELTDMERAFIRIESLEGHVREMQGRLLTLEEAWQDFIPSVTRRITNDIILPSLIHGLSDAMEFPPSAVQELPDELDVHEVIEAAKTGLDIHAIIENAKKGEAD